MKLTVFYDGLCPLCNWEMDKLKALNHARNLIFIDIHSQAFSNAYPQISFENANARIQGLLPNGTTISGLDVTYLAWKLVGKGWLYAPLRWPIIRIVADWFYVWFANNRYQVSYWLTGKKPCRTCANGAKETSSKD